MHMEIRGQAQVLACISHFLWDRSLVEAGFQFSDFLGCTCLCLLPVCSFGVIQVHMSGFMWFLGIPTQGLTPRRQALCRLSHCSVLWVVLSAYRLVPALVCWDFKLGIVTAHLSCDFLDLCPWHISLHWFCKLLFTNIYHTEGKVGISWDLFKVTDQETDVFIRLLMHKTMFLLVFVLFWSAVSYLLIVYLVFIFTDIWLTNFHCV